MGDLLFYVAAIAFVLAIPLIGYSIYRFFKPIFDDPYKNEQPSFVSLNDEVADGESAELSHSKSQIGSVPMRLMFKRSQTSRTPPTFTLHIALELPEEIAVAARHYGVYKDIVYIDPKLSDARTLRAKQASQQYKDMQLQYEIAKSGAFSNEMRTDIAVNLFFNALKWSVLLPFYIVWRMVKWIISERKQTIRFHQLPHGKTISSKNLAELFDAENQIKESLNAIVKFIDASSNYNDREVLIIPKEEA